ncbi:ribonuclease H-like domain-containing protein [Tanacetum coccineum]
MTDAKDIWDAIKSRFGGNDKSKKMQKYILKQQFEGFSVSNSEGLHKGYDRFQSLLSQLEIHGAGVSTEDVKSRKFLRIYKPLPCPNGPHLDHEDLEQLDEFDLEEMDLKWQVAMISMRLKKFYKKTGRKLHFDAKEPVRFDKIKFECYNYHKTGRPGKQEEPKALVTLDGEGVDWTDHAEDEQENFALMAYSNSGSDTEVEAQLVTHQKNQLWYEEKIRIIKIDLDDKTDVLTYHKKLLVEAVKEKEELKTKLKNFQSSSKGLSKLLNSQMSKRDKSGLGYRDQAHDGLSMHAVPPLMTGNYMPSGPDREVDDSMFTYGPKQSKNSESDTQTSNFDSCESNSSVETLKSMLEPVVVEPKVPVRSEKQVNKTAGLKEANHSAGTQDHIDVGNSEMEVEPTQDYFVLPIWSFYTSTIKSSEANNEGKKPNKDTDLKTNEEPVGQEDQAFFEELERLKRQEQDIIEFCGSKGIKREYSNARTPQQNGVAERKNMTLIEAARAMPVRSENQANKTASPKETNHSTFKSSEAKNEGEKPNKDTGLETNKEPIDQEDQAFLEKLERLKRQKKEGNDAARALRKEFAQEAEDLC